MPVPHVSILTLMSGRAPPSGYVEKGIDIEDPSYANAPATPRGSNAATVSAAPTPSGFALPTKWSWGTIAAANAIGAAAAALVVSGVRKAATGKAHFLQSLAITGTVAVLGTGAVTLYGVLTYRH